MALIKRDDSSSLISNNLSQGHTHTILGPEAEFEGKLVFKGAVRVDGQFKGEIITDDTLVVGEHAKVECQLVVGTLIVNGVFKGNVQAVHGVELHKTARFYGDIKSPNLVIEEGAIFEGTCKMENAGESRPSAGVRMSPQALEATDL